MSSADLIDARSIPPLSRRQSIELARLESDRFAELLRSLRGNDWEQPTDCALWTVRDIAVHQLAVAECWASPRAFLSMYLRGLPVALRMRGLPVDGANQVGIADRAHLATEELLDRFDQSRQRMLRVRATAGTALRAIRLPAGPTGWMSLGELFDVILTRDTWTHRLDICRATGRVFQIDPARDRPFVADMVRDWSRRHGRPFTLRLSGPLGGAYRGGAGGDEIGIDAVEFVRAVSGRRREEGLLSLPILF